MSKKKSSTETTKKENLPSETKSLPEKKTAGPTGPTGAVLVTQSTSQLLNYLVVNSLTGPTGPTGEKGADGKPGIQGTAGVDGKPGIQGTAGVDGKPGIQGTAGVDGKPGIQGTAGVDGKPGIQGTAGADGKPGSDGKPGIQGTAGVDGKPGIQGTAGADGKPGSDGKPGIQGTAGVDGKPGIQGTAGVDGKPGIQGTAGTDGKPGSDGKPGIQGTAGTDGKPGSDGKPGPTGPTGPGFESGTIILRKTNEPVTGYAPLNMVVAGFNDVWNQCGEPPTPVYDAGMVADESTKSIYLLGGMGPTGHSISHVQRFNTVNKIWDLMNVMTERKSLCTAVVYKTEMVCAGGIASNNQATKSVFVLYNGAWQKYGGGGGEMAEAVAGAAAAVFNNKLYLFGGQNAAYPPIYYDYTQVLDNGKWQKLDSHRAPFNFSLASATVYDNKIYVYGGVTRSGTHEDAMPVMSYDPATGKWLEVAKNTTGLIHGSAIMKDNTIYYVGGNVNRQLQPQAAVREAFSYNVITGNTSMLGPGINTPRISANAAIIGRQLFLTGGGTGAGLAMPLKTEYTDLDASRFYLHKKV